MKTANRILPFFSVLLVCLIFSLTLSPDSLSSSAYQIINQGLFVTLSGYLLLPSAQSSGALLRNSAAAAIILILLSQLPMSGVIPVPIILQVSLVTFCLSLFLWSLRQSLTAILGDRFDPFKPILLFTATVILAPVWCGPLVDIYHPADGVINTIIYMTPLTHFSVAAEYDYLRSEWFYQNTPFGSLPFSYPDLFSLLSVYLLSIFSLQILLWQVTRKKIGVR